MKSDLGTPTTRAGANFSHMSDIRGCAGKWVDFTQKIRKHWSHFDPPPEKKKNPETWVKFVKSQRQNHGENFGK